MFWGSLDNFQFIIDKISFKCTISLCLQFVPVLLCILYLLSRESLMFQLNLFCWPVRFSCDYFRVYHLYHIFNLLQSRSSNIFLIFYLWHSGANPGPHTRQARALHQNTPRPLMVNISETCLNCNRNPFISKCQHCNYT